MKKRNCRLTNQLNTRAVGKLDMRVGKFLSATPFYYIFNFLRFRIKRFQKLNSTNGKPVAAQQPPPEYLARFHPSNFKVLLFLTRPVSNLNYFENSTSHASCFALCIDAA